ncbi:MAG: AAA family ATPase [Spirochaetes bacterium]|nr:AAA family ATPase [Spirochaetota bacterium]
MSTMKGFNIVIAGKGGTGKTLVSALLVRDQIKHGSVLAIDADADSNLPEILGVNVTKTVGDVRENLLAFKTRHTENVHMTPDKIMEQGIMEAIVEEHKFDLLVMGRGEGEGCYCAVNNILRSIIDTQVKNYETTIIDSEAGLEHISRRTARDVDVMLVVTDTSARGLTTAKRVVELSDELRVDFGRILVVANKVTDATRAIIDEQAKKNRLEVIGYLPVNDQVAANDALGKSIWELPDDNPVVIAAQQVFQKIDEVRKAKQSSMRL